MIDASQASSCVAPQDAPMYPHSCGVAAVSQSGLAHRTARPRGPNLRHLPSRTVVPLHASVALDARLRRGSYWTLETAPAARSGLRAASSTAHPSVDLDGQAR